MHLLLKVGQNLRFCFSKLQTKTDYFSETWQVEGACKRSTQFNFGIDLDRIPESGIKIKNTSFIILRKYSLQNSLGGGMFLKVPSSQASCLALYVVLCLCRPQEE